MAIRLDEVKPGTVAVVEGVRGEGAVRRRILDMGILKGVRIQVIKVAPLGDPIEVKLRNYSLSLRKSEAEWIDVEGEEA